MKKTGEELITGSIPQAIMRLAGPMFISAFLQNAQNLIDLYWVGRLGPVSVAALALSGVVLMALFPVMMGLATGTVAFVSRAYGARRFRRAATLAGNSLVLGVICGIIVAVVFLPWVSKIALLLGAEPDVAEQATLYLRASLYGMSISMVLFIANSALQASGNTVVPMLAMLSANIMNMILDPIFIFDWGLGYGVSGAAWATNLANLLASVGLIYVLASGKLGLHLRIYDFRLRIRDSLRLLRVGLPSMAQMTSRSLMGLVFFRIIARFGTAVVAGYGIGMRWHQVMLMPCFVLGNATATLVGQNLGARKTLRAKRSALTSVGMIVSITLVTTILLFIFCEQAVAVFDNTPEVVKVGKGFLRTVTPFYILIGASIVLDRALNGAGCTVATMSFTIFTLWGIQVPLALFFSHWFAARGLEAVYGVWWAMNAASVVSLTLSASWFSTGRWMRKKILH